jgi:hypothetical protein
MKFSKGLALIVILAFTLSGCGHNSDLLPSAMAAPAPAPAPSLGEDGQLHDANGVIVPKAPDDINVKPGDVPTGDTSTKMDQQISSWAQADVKWMNDNKITPEVLQGDYQKNITREEFATLVVNAVNYLSMGVKESWARVDSKFKDSDNTQVYKAYSVGVVNGVSDTEFKPTNNITRQEAAVMLSNMLKTVKAANVSTDDFSYLDKLSIASWAVDSVNITSNAKIFQGEPNGFKPLANYTREQSMVTMHRLIESVGKSDGYSFRGRVYVKYKDIWNQKLAVAPSAGTSLPGFSNAVVGSTWASFGSPGDDLPFYLDALESNFKPETIDKLRQGSSKETDGDYVIETGLKDSVIKISW